LGYNSVKIVDSFLYFCFRTEHAVCKNASYLHSNIQVPDVSKHIVAASVVQSNCTNQSITEDHIGSSLDSEVCVKPQL